jgi:hypothetical protein
MDSALAQTLEAMTDPTRVTWTTERPAVDAEPAANELFLGVGSRAPGATPHPRLLSWKLAHWRTAALRSTTEVVLRSAEALDALALPITFRLHDPTLDCTTAAVLATFRVLHKRWPASTEALTEYVSEWEQGRTESAGAYERALASVFYASMHFRSNAVGPSREMLELLIGVLDAPPATLASLPASSIPGRVARRLKADADLYRAELTRAWQVQVDLPLDDQPTSAYRRIDALFLSSPQDVTVLKLLARPDQTSSSSGRGFELLAIHAPNEKNAWGRHTISIAPESPGTLGDLALRLDTLEGALTPDGKPRARGQPRFPSQPAALEGLSDPWYSDGYAWAKGRSTIVAPPFAGTRLERGELWESVWQRFHVGRNVHVTASRTVFCRPRRVKLGVDATSLVQAGWSRSRWPAAIRGFLPSIEASFLGDERGVDVEHLERPCALGTVHVSLYPSHLALIWVERAGGATTLLAQATEQAELVGGKTLEALPELIALAPSLEEAAPARWSIFGAYTINRARSTMLDGSRSVQGLLHALASGDAPTLANLPSQAAIDARTVHALRDVEHWFTATGGARLTLELDDTPEPSNVDHDFALFLLTTGQRSVAFEITRRMGEVERKSRTSRWQSLTPTANLRGDVMLFTNSLWYPRVSDDPDLDARYDAWRALHGMTETVESLRSQTTELDEYRKERFENMVGLLLFLFLPITIASGFFSGAQFNEMDLRQGLPWTTGGWKLFGLYTAFFSVLVFGAVGLGRLFSWRARR